MKYWLRQEGKNWGEGSRLSSTSRGHRTFVQRLRSSLPVCEQAHHSRIAGDCPQAYGLGAGDGHPLGMPHPPCVGSAALTARAGNLWRGGPGKGPHKPQSSPGRARSVSGQVTTVPPWSLQGTEQGPDASGSWELGNEDAKHCDTVPTWPS